MYNHLRPFLFSRVHSVVVSVAEPKKNAKPHGIVAKRVETMKYLILPKSRELNT